MFYEVTPKEFRANVESCMEAENERLRLEDPQSPTYRLYDGNQKANIPDEGSLVLKKDGNPIIPSIALYRLRMDYQELLMKTGMSHTKSLQVTFLQDAFQDLKGSFNSVTMQQIGEIYDPKAVIDNIFPCVCETSRNQKWLADTPHREIHDLSIYYRIRLDIFENSDLCGTVVVRDHIMEEWNYHSLKPVTEETLFAKAYENGQRECEIKSMGAMMEQFLGIAPEYPPEDEPYGMPDDSEEAEMYIVTNRSKEFGAAVALMGIGLDKLSRVKDTDFYILPSSIHETILVPDTGDFLPEDLGKFVYTVNRKVVKPEERLSDSVYYYDRTTRSVQIAYDVRPEAQQQRMAQEKAQNHHAGVLSPRRGR